MKIQILEDKMIMQDLEKSFLNVLLLTHGITEKIEKKFIESKLTNIEFINEYPSYADLNQLMYQSALLQARKLWEANHRYNLTNEEWLKVREFRNEIVHSDDKNKQNLKIIGDLNFELIPLLNKISKAIYEKYNLNGNLKYEEYVNKYLRDIENL